MTDFDRALEFTLAWEGGATLTRDPDDPGGVTKYGIAKKFHPDVDVEHLTYEAAADIYDVEYWHGGGCHLLPSPLNIVHFDTCVNVGPGRAAGFLKMARGDVAAYLDARRQHYHLVVAKRPVMQKYLKGWLNRINALAKLVAA